MPKFEVTANYCTWHGNPASCRRVVQAPDHNTALNMVAAKVRKFKRFMGKLDMECTQLSEV